MRKANVFCRVCKIKSSGEIIIKSNFLSYYIKYLMNQSMYTQTGQIHLIKKNHIHHKIITIIEFREKISRIPTPLTQEIRKRKKNTMMIWKMMTDLFCSCLKMEKLIFFNIINSGGGYYGVGLIKHKILKNYQGYLFAVFIKICIIN